jgi:hypothetical protein
MSTSGEMLRWPQRARRSTIQAGVCARVLTPRTTRPLKRRTEIGRLHAHRQVVGHLHGDSGKLRLHQRRVGQRRDFTRNAVHAQAMREVGRELEREQHVVEAQLLADVASDDGVIAQLQQAVALFGNLQFLGRAQHALALDAAQLAQLDGERLAIFARRQQRTDRGTRDLDAGTRVGRTADDVQRSPAPRPPGTRAGGRRWGVARRSGSGPPPHR